MRLSALLLLALFVSAAPASAAPSFEVWLKGVEREAKKKGIGKKGRAALTDLKPIPKVIELDRKQPESRMTFEDYFAKVVHAQRIADGKRLLAEHRALLDEVADKHGLDPEFLVALWGVETNYGRITGDYPIINALATLAHEGRRAKFFRAQLFEALRIIDQGHISAEEMKGSWAGAMGQCQFMPGTFNSYAVDHDGDGRKNIWTTQADVFGSSANYLRRIKWKRGAGWGQEVQLPPGFDPALVSRHLEKPVSEWAKLGVKSLDGKPLEGTHAASVVLPGGKSQRAFLIHGNYRVLLHWNRSEFFATVVSLLADAIAHEEAPKVAEPAPE